MFKKGFKGLLTVVLSILMIQPSGLIAAPKDAGTRSALGMISPRGSVLVGQTSMPSESALFAGDSVRTINGSASVQYKGGARIFLGSDSAAEFSAAKVRLDQGMMTFQTASSGMEFAASTLRLQPSTPKAAASLTLQKNQASISVSEGTINVIDPSGVQLASLRAGEARLFEEAPIATAPAPAAPPQQGGGNSASNSNGDRKWLIALGVGVVGASLGIAGLVHANDANSRSDSQAALVQQVTSQSAALTTQVNALRAQVAALQAFASSVAATSAQQATLIQQLATTVAELADLQARLAAAQEQFNQILQSVGPGGILTAAQLSQLQSLSAQMGRYNFLLSTVGQRFTAISNGLSATRPPGFSPVRLP